MDNHYPYTRGQVITLLRNSEFYLHGEGTPVHKKKEDISYKTRRINPHAIFEEPMMLWAELQVRIAQTGQDGYYLEQVYSSENQLAEMERIARAFNLDINEVSTRVEKALRYVQGWCRRWQKCSACRVKDCPKRGKKKAYEYKVWRY